MDKCNHYGGNQYCNLYKQKVASAYCGDICKNMDNSDKEMDCLACNLGKEKACKGCTVDWSHEGDK